MGIMSINATKSARVISMKINFLPLFWLETEILTIICGILIASNIIGWVIQVTLIPLILDLVIFFSFPIVLLLLLLFGFWLGELGTLS
jgi:hypothetical protein